MIGIGSTVGNYRVVKKLGSGAMGSVYLAEHPTIGKRVALKVIHADLAENEEMLSRFFNEARAVTQIGHANIVEVMDFGQTPDGDNFIVMELLEGRGLGDKLKETPVLGVDEAIKIAVQIADGLEASHKRGIIHRDLKPDNVFLIMRLGIPDFVKILDFGLAKLTQGGGAMSHKTRAGSVLGTPHYMAPEQCEGKPDIDHRVDVYALGCIMYQMLCGRVPFPGEGFGEVLVKHLREPPLVPTKLNPSIPRPVEAIILHALAKRKEFRFQSMKEMAKALRDPAGYMRELSGEVPFGTPTLEGAAPPLRAGAAPRPPGPVRKTGDASPTMLENLPDTVSANAGRRAPPNPTPAPMASQATMMLEAPVLPGAPSVATSGQSDQFYIPARSPLLGIGGKRVAVVAGTVLAVLVVGILGARVLGHRGPSAEDEEQRPRVVIVASDPPGADVLRDGATIGTSPVVLKLRRGEPTADITLRMDGYVDLKKSLDASNEGQIMLSMRPVPTVAPRDPPPAADPGSVAARPTQRTSPTGSQSAGAGAAAERRTTPRPKRVVVPPHPDEVLEPQF